MGITLQIDQENFDTPILLEDGSATFSKPQILSALFASYPQRKVFLKNTPSTSYKIKIQDPRSPTKRKITLDVTLENDIIYRPSTSSLSVRPEVIFRPVIEKGVRTLKPHIIYRPQKNAKGEARYSVMSKEVSISQRNVGAIGGGSMGAVYPVLGTLAKLGSGWAFKANKKRAMKVQMVDDEEEKASVIKESNFLTQAGHMAGKELVMENDRAFIVQALGKRSLYSFLSEEKSNGPILTIDQRYQLSINILRALKEQIHDRGICSRDIKPHNILIDRETLEVKIIDMGFAKNIIDKEDNTACGTPGWVAPEFRQPADERNDYFSMGIVLSELWGNPFDARPTLQILYERDWGRPVDFSHLFEDLNLTQEDPAFTLNQAQKKEIEKTIMSLAAIDKNQRESIDQAITEFELGRLKGMNREPDVDKIQTAIGAGKELRAKLIALGNPRENIIEDLENALKLSANDVRDPNQEKIYQQARRDYKELMDITKKFEKLLRNGKAIPNSLTVKLESSLEKATKSLDQLETQLKISKPVVEKIKDAFSQALAAVADQPIALKAFVDTLQIKCLANISDKTELTKTVSDVADKASKNISIICEISKRLEAHQALDPALKELHASFVAELNRILNKYDSKSITVDRLNELNVNFTMHIRHIDEKTQKLINFSKKMNSLISLQGNVKAMQQELSKVKDQTLRTKMTSELSALAHVLNSDLASARSLRVDSINDAARDELHLKVQQRIANFNAILSHEKLPPVLTLSQQVQNVKANLTADDPNKETKISILKTIEDYITETFTAKNIDKKSQIASPERQADIANLLKVISDPDPKPNFADAVENALNQMKTGFEKTKLGSLSVINMFNKRFSDFKYSPFGSFVFKSELRWRIKNVLMQAEDSPVKNIHK